MKFAEALNLLEEGKKVSSPTVLSQDEYLAMDDVGIAVFDSIGWNNSVDLSAELLKATDFYEVPTIEEPVTMYGYFNTEKGRWMSTNNPEAIRAKGIEVKTFVVQD